VLDASVSVATECVRATTSGNDVIAVWLQMWFRECVREDMTLAYQRQALVQAGKFVEQCAPVLAAQSGGAASARFDAAALVTLTMERLGAALLAGWSADDTTTPAAGSTATTTDDVILEQRRTKPARLALAASAFGVLQQLFACNRSVGRVRMASSGVVTLLVSALTAPWNIQAAAAQVVAQAASALPSSGVDAGALVRALCQLTTDSSYAAVRADAFDALCALAESDVGVLDSAAQATAARARSEGSADDASHARKLLALLTK
jgi:hypothetical protein